MIRNSFRVILAFAIALATPAFAAPDLGNDAGQGHDGDGQNGTILNVLASAIPVGVLSTSFGQAELELDTEGGQRRRLHVEVEANVSDGILVGSLTFRLHEAEFQLESENAMLPTGLDSIAAIRTLQVVDAGGAVLPTANL